MRKIWDEADFYERENFLQEKGSRERQKNCKGKLYYEGPNLFYEA